MAKSEGEKGIEQVHWGAFLRVEGRRKKRKPRQRWGGEKEKQKKKQKKASLKAN